jgi:hypothetical protein
MNLLEYFLPPFILKPYRDLARRIERTELSVHRLETALEALVVSPQYTPDDVVAFNGQKQRKRIFADIVSAIPFDAIVETGACLGDTTRYLSQTTRQPVYSCEISRTFFSLAKMRLADLNAVRLELTDSRQFLRKLGGKELVDKSIFFYLDAHWYDDLPVTEELDIIGSCWKQFVVMIDDFKVPCDRDYGYDDYGDNKVLNLELLKPVMTKHSLIAYFPAVSSKQETGARRGCVVVASRGEISQKLSRLASLRQWKQ